MLGISIDACYFVGDRRSPKCATTIVADLIDSSATDASGTGVTRIGVTGHRSLADPTSARRLCIDAITRVRADRHAATIEIWSSLAEGSDRIVAELVPDHADRLIAVLPLEASDYRQDFSTEASRARFDALVAAAARVEITGPDAGATRESAYERAGLVIVERCDVLLALWDGEPGRGRGGTAEIVRAARERGRIVMHVPVTRAPS